MNYIILKDEFKNEINGNFLIKILSFTLKEFPYINNYFDITNPNSSNFDKNLIIKPLVNPYYEICRHIIGLHKSNTFGLTEEEIKQKIKDYNYQQKLTQEVITNIKLRKYGSAYFRNNTIFDGERYLYYHIPYYLFVICMRIEKIFKNRPDLSKSLNYEILKKLSTMGISALLLIENNCLDNAYGICRKMLEFFTNYYIFNDNTNILNSYKKFLDEEISYLNSNNYSLNFSEMFENRISKNNKIQKHDFLHYGWVDNIKNYHNIVKENPYSRLGLISYLQYSHPETRWEVINKAYSICNQYSHASMISSYSDIEYIQLINILYHILIPIYNVICKDFNIDSKINGIDILSILQEKFEMLQRRSKNTKNLVKKD